MLADAQPCPAPSPAQRSARRPPVDLLCAPLLRPAVPGVLEGVPSSRGYKGGFSSHLMVKDLTLAAHAAEHCHASAPMADAARK